MKSVIVLLSVAIACSAFSFPLVQDFKLDISSLKRQSSASTCTVPTTDNTTYIDINGACSITNYASVCKRGLNCVTTNGGIDYNCRFLTPTTTCVGSSDCRGPCLGGFCALGNILPGGTCTGDANCVSTRCNNGKCAAGVVGSSCTGSVTCAAGLFCNYNNTASAGVCTTRVAAGASCLSYYRTQYDYFLICAKGQVCSTVYNSTLDVTSATCSAILSVSAGTTVDGIYGFLLCKSGLYATYNGGFSFVCSATASCNDDNLCISSNPDRCNCPSSGNGNGTCSSACVSQASSVIPCLFNADFGLYSEVSSAYDSTASCHSEVISYSCCANTAFGANAYTGYCSSAAIVAPVMIMMAILALLL